MESGTIVKWLKAEGDAVEKGEPLYELDTEKVTQEVEAEAAGVLLKIAVSEGEVPVGTTIAYIGEAGEQMAAETEAEPEPARRETPGRARADARGGRGGASRTAGRRAGQGIAARTAPGPRAGNRPGHPFRNGSGRTHRGRGHRARCDGSAARRGATARGGATGCGAPLRAGTRPQSRSRNPPPPAVTSVPADVERVPLTSIRRTIARRLTDAWKVPVFQLVLSADMDAVNHFVERRRALDPDEE